MNYRKIYAIKKANEQRIKKICTNISEKSGIYIFERVDEEEYRYIYVGQAKNLLKRTAEHLQGYQHIDCSIKKHKLYDKLKHPYGWQLSCGVYSLDQLDEQEKYWVDYYRSQPCTELYNATTGGQGAGKKTIKDYGVGGYRKGVTYGYNKARNEIATLIHKYTTGLTSKGGKIADRKTAELQEMLKEK